MDNVGDVDCTAEKQEKGYEHYLGDRELSVDERVAGLVPLFRIVYGIITSPTVKDGSNAE